MSIDPNSLDYMPSPLNKSVVDKFLLVINIPPALKKINSKSIRNNKSIQLDTLQFSVWGAVVPRINVPAIDLKYMGANMPVSTHARPSWDPVTVNFHVDNLWSNYWVIYKWLDLMRSDEDGQFGAIVDDQGILDSSASLPEYSTEMVVYSLDEYDKPTVKWVYTYAFPTNLGSVEFNEQQTSQVKCDFTFQFSQLQCELV
jgi:hypothetical protein